MALGHVTHRGLGVRRTRITIRTPGGHSWIDYGQPSAIHELTALSTRLTALDLPPTPRTTLNIGIISGGTSVNTIAAEAMLELDLRSESDEALEALAGQVEQIVQAAKKPGVTVEAEMIGWRPSGELPAEHPLVRLAQDCLRAVGVEPHLKIGSTDANLPLSRGLASITIGLTTGGRAHTVDEFIDLAPLEKGMEQLTRLVSRVWDTL
jgi:acetylornithine deacetylase/succinyl-diaminopimelate desuccinylase-like protein